MTGLMDCIVDSMACTENLEIKIESCNFISIIPVVMMDYIEAKLVNIEDLPENTPVKMENKLGCPVNTKIIF